jgi:hypothetical protein
MKYFLIATAVVTFFSGVSVLFPVKAAAAGVNCSYDACLKQCNKNGATQSGCSVWCTKAIRDRTFAGQCK